MSTKNNPSKKYDCYSAAEPDEPMFILLARDPIAPILVLAWMATRAKLRGHNAKCDEAMECAISMLEWKAKRDGTGDVDAAVLEFKKLVETPEFQGSIEQTILAIGEIKATVS